MKKSIKILSAAAMTAAFVCSETKRRKKKAKKEGRHVPYGPYEAVLKRPLDILIVGMALVPLVPVMGGTALLVRKKLGSPVLFTQKRPGKDEKLFKLYKFRTMTGETDENGELLPDEERLTAFGKWLRSTSLDELPELWNILRGDMSIVGPRPQLVRDMVFMSDEQRQRHEVRPGLTGLAQINGRNAITWDKKLGKDLAYCKKITFLGDAMIILYTMKQVLTRDGISGDGMATALDYGDWLLLNGQISSEEYVKRQEEANNRLRRTK